MTYLKKHISSFFMLLSTSCCANEAFDIESLTSPLSQLAKIVTSENVSSALKDNSYMIFNEEDGAFYPDPEFWAQQAFAQVLNNSSPALEDNSHMIFNEEDNAFYPDPKAWAQQAYEDMQEASPKKNKATRKRKLTKEVDENKDFSDSEAPLKKKKTYKKKDKAAHLVFKKNMDKDDLFNELTENLITSIKYGGKSPWERNRSAEQEYAANLSEKEQKERATIIETIEEFKECIDPAIDFEKSTGNLYVKFAAIAGVYLKKKFSSERKHLYSPNHISRVLGIFDSNNYMIGEKGIESAKLRILPKKASKTQR